MNVYRALKGRAFMCVAGIGDTHLVPQYDFAPYMIISSNHLVQISLSRSVLAREGKLDLVILYDINDYNL